MPVREVLRLPHPALKAVARPVAPMDADLIERVAGDLTDTMRANHGCVGLAATQIEELVRIVVVDVTGHPKAEECNGLLVLVNPQLVTSAGTEVAREGCLSIPELTANVRRATEITLAASAPGGEQLEIESRGFEARCLQHELDHLDGVLFLDRVASKTDVFPRKRGSEPPRGPEASAP